MASLLTFQQLCTYFGFGCDTERLEFEVSQTSASQRISFTLPRLTHALVLASAPIHLRVNLSGHTDIEILATDRDSPKESVINAEPIMRRNLVASTRESG